MIRSSLWLKALGLGVLVLGLTAFAASIAQAEAGATWRVAGAAIPGANDLLPQLEIKELGARTASLSFTTGGGTAVLVLCTEANFDEGGKLIAEGTISLGRVLSKGCVTLLNEAVSPACKPHSPGKPLGEILSERFKGLIVLDTLPGGAVDNLVKLTPEDAAGNVSRRLAVIELGEECAIGEEFNVETTALGEGMWIRDCMGNASFTEEKVEHLIEEGLGKLLALGQPATILGSAQVRLSGAHLGLKWSGHPA